MSKLCCLKLLHLSKSANVVAVSHGTNVSSKQYKISAAIKIMKMITYYTKNKSKS